MYRRIICAEEKTLSSRYFYDEEGDELFRQIMNLDEYYLTRAEYDVFTPHKKRILELMGDGNYFRW